MPDVRDRPGAQQARPVQAQRPQPPAAARISIDQQRAAFAWSNIQKIDPRVLGDYTNLAKSAPALLMSNGLMQTLAFLNSKGKEQHTLLNKHVFGWLTGQSPVLRNCPPDFKSVMDKLSNADTETYRRATEETFALLRWIRQFAAAAEKTGGER